MGLVFFFSLFFHIFIRLLSGKKTFFKYMTSSLGVREEKKPAWTEEEEEELRRLYEEHRHSDGKLKLLVCSTLMMF